MAVLSRIHEVGRDREVAGGMVIRSEDVEGVDVGVGTGREIERVTWGDEWTETVE